MLFSINEPSTRSSSALSTGKVIGESMGIKVHDFSLLFIFKGVQGKLRFGRLVSDLFFEETKYFMYAAVRSRGKYYVSTSVLINTTGSTLRLLPFTFSFSFPLKNVLLQTL